MDGAHSRRGPVAGALFALVVLAALAVEARTVPAARVVHAPVTALATAEASTNWAGYAAVAPSGAAPLSFTSVTGTWTQSTAICGADDGTAASAVWVGLGGYDDRSQALEQIGTDADCSAAGAPQYYAWYELVPSPPVNLTIKINPGDTITTSVNVAGNTVTLQLKDRTRGTVFTKRATINAPDTSSAEWIAEAPSSCSDFSCTPLPLTNFGSIMFTKIATIASGHPGTLSNSAWSVVPIQLVPHARGGFGFFPGPNRGYVTYDSTAGTAAPASPSPDGRSFTLSWVSDAGAAAANSAPMN